MDAEQLIELFEERAAIRESECSDIFRDKHGGDKERHRKWAERTAYSDLRMLIGPSAPMPQEIIDIVKRARQ